MARSKFLLIAIFGKFVGAKQSICQREYSNIREEFTTNFLPQICWERKSDYTAGDLFWRKNCKFSSLSHDRLIHKQPTTSKYISQVFLLCQLWIVNYCLKSLSNNLSNKNINTGITREMVFQKKVHFGIHVLSLETTETPVFIKNFINWCFSAIVL